MLCLFRTCMASTEHLCARCGAPLSDDAPHVWLTIQGVNLEYELLDGDLILCEDCFAAYRNFINQPTQYNK